jgi:hypothetical protein
MPSSISHSRPALILLSMVLAIHSLAQAGTDDLEAVIPVEVLPVDASLATGKIAGGGLRWSDPVVALQPARIARGIVIDETNGRGKVLALAVLGKPERDSQGRLRLDVPLHQQAWCDLPGFGIPVSRCFQDSDSDGKLDAARKGMLAAANPLTLSRVEAAEAIAAIPYRAAREDELPQYRVGYVSCGVISKDGADPQYRFATAVRPASGVFWPPPTMCNEIAKPLGQRDGEDPVYRFGRFEVAVATQKNSIETRLIEGIPAGTLLGHLAIDQPLMDAVDATATLAAKLDDKPFLYFSSPPQIAESVGKNQNLLRAQVSHGLTGKLAGPVTRAGWTGSKTWPVGTQVFGVVMQRSRQPQTFAPDIIWCIPERDAKGRWDTQCVLPTESNAVLVRAIPSPFVVAYLLPGSSSPHVLPAVVERGPVDFGGPLHLTIRYAGSERRHVNLEWGVGLEEESMTNRLQLRRADDGSGQLFVAGMLIKVQPIQDGAIAMLTKLGEEYRVDVDALPVDAHAILGKN